MRRYRSCTGANITSLSLNCRQRSLGPRQWFRLGVLRRHLSKPMTPALQTRRHLGLERSCLPVRERSTPDHHRCSEISLARWFSDCRKSRVRREFRSSEDAICLRRCPRSRPSPIAMGDGYQADAVARSKGVGKAVSLPPVTCTRLRGVQSVDSVRNNSSPTNFPRCGGISCMVWSYASTRRPVMWQGVKE